MKLVYTGTTTEYKVKIAAIKSNVLQVLGNLPMKEKGFKLIDDEGNEYDYSAYKTLYRAVQGGYQYSNDGETWDEPTKTITVSVDWSDDVDAEGYRPESVDVTVKFGDTVIEVATLSEENEWHKKYANVPESHEYTVEADDIENYTTEISGTTVIYTMVAPYVPSVEEQLVLMEEMVMDLDERVSALEG